MLEVSSVTKKYGPLTALDNVSFVVPHGQILGLLGQNGAGKTTTLNIITGCLAADSGTVRINGSDLLRDHRQAKRNIGYLPEAAPLYDEMSVREYLRFVCRLREVEKSEIPAHITEIGIQTGLTGIMDRIIGHLSKGLRQRVGLAQALCGLPGIIVLDEPTAGLDPAQTVEFRQLVRELSGKHTVIFSSHMLPEVQSVCDRVLILHHGKLIFDSTSLNGDAGTIRLRAKIAMGNERLLPALRALGGLISAEEVRGGEPGLTEVILTANADAQIERRLFDLLTRMNAPLLRLSSDEISLESIFLQATKA